MRKVRNPIRHLLSGSSAVPATCFFVLMGLGTAGTANAQSAPATPTGGTISNEQVPAKLDAAPPAAGDNSAKVSTNSYGPDTGDIIVTARKRSEALMNVPASVFVTSAATLDRQRITSVDNLFGKVPSLYFSANFLSPGRDFINLVVRGVGAQSVGVPSVGTYIDGVYTPALGFDIGFLDLERVEVLEGPQGTLFGRNTEGGALNIITRKPTQEFHLKAQAGYDNFQTFTGMGSVSGGLTSTLAGSLAASYSHTNGYLKAQGLQQQLEALSGQPEPSISADDFRKVTARAALRWTPSDRTTVDLEGDISDGRGHEGLPGVPIKGLPGGRGETFAGPKYDIFSDFQAIAHNGDYGGSLTIDQDLGFAKLTSITGARHLFNISPFDFDGGTDLRGNEHDLRQYQTTKSQELRLAGNATKTINYLVGIFGFDEDDNQFRHYNLQSTPQFTGINVTHSDQYINRRGWAVFGQASWTPIPSLEVTAGVRYSWERARSTLVSHYTLPNFGTPPALLTVDGTTGGKATFSNVSPTGSIRYTVVPGVSVYGRYAKGFKAGGFPVAASLSTDIAYKAETSDNYEIGVKSELLNRRLTFNLTLYDVELSNQQLSTVVRNALGLPVASVGNAGKSRSKGIEFSMTANPVKGLTFGANAGYTDAKYVNYIDTKGKNRDGEIFPFVPKETASATVDYEHAVWGDWTGDIGASYKYVGKILSGTGVDLDLQFPVPSYYQVDLRAGVSKGPWKIDAYVDNVTNKYIVTRIFNSFFFPDPPARPFASVSPPRRVGFRVTYQM